MSSYSGLAASSYDQQTTSGNTIYGALGSNQPYVDGYGVPPSGLSKGASFHFTAGIVS